MRIYLDHNATTPVRPEVAEAMSKVLREVHGNPSSVHAEGAAARRELDLARDRVASLLGVAPGDVIFTGSATEANNTVVRTLAAARGPERTRIVTTTVEHPSVDASLEAWGEQGFPVTQVPVDAGGRVAVESVGAALEADTALLSVIWANNETGVLQPVEALATLARERGVWFHTDATQAVGKHPVPLGTLPIDALSLSAHKFGGPKGVGALVVRGDLPDRAFVRGGPQERRRRGGTENLAGIVGLGLACALAEAELDARVARYAQLRDRLWDGIREKVPDVTRHGDADHVLANTLNLRFDGAAGELLLQALDLEGVAASAGAACASGSIEPSHVLSAMGLTPDQARATLRLSVGEGVDEAQIDRVVALLPDLVRRAREAA
ncbi:MAG: cysteine desulfurase family protein [Myxococcota bacterium]